MVKPVYIYCDEGSSEIGVQSLLLAVKTAFTASGLSHQCQTNYSKQVFRWLFINHARWSRFTLLQKIKRRRQS